MTHLTALIAEDEPAIRAVASEALSYAGFRVIEAADAAEALSLLEEQGETIDALFTDLRMPGAMDGLDLARHVHDHWPWVKRLVTSGHGQLLARDLSDDTQFLAKPYDVSRIPTRIREMIVAG